MHVLILHGIQSEAGAHWMRWLGHQLEKEGHKVIMPQFPSPDHPERFDWLSFVKERLQGIPLSKLVIIGHSLGVVTALDFIEQSDKKIHGFISVSGFARDYGNELNSYFMKEKDLNLVEVREKIHQLAVFYGSNDPYVSQEALQYLAEELEVNPIIVDRGGHLNSEAGYTEFPELLAITLEICKDPKKK